MKKASETEVKRRRMPNIVAHSLARENASSAFASENHASTAVGFHCEPMLRAPLYAASLDDAGFEVGEVHVQSELRIGSARDAAAVVDRIDQGAGHRRVGIGPGEGVPP